MTKTSQTLELFREIVRVYRRYRTERDRDEALGVKPRFRGQSRGEEQPYDGR
jgi:hypothetical protein